MTKTDRNKKIMKMLGMGVSMADAARGLGISRQRVLQIVQANGGLPDGYERNAQTLRGRKVEAINLLRHVPIAEAARRMGVSYKTMFLLAKKEGIQPIPYQHLEPGCPKCATYPYGRGYCRNCYSRWQRKEKRNGKESNN